MAKQSSHRSCHFLHPAFICDKLFWDESEPNHRKRPPFHLDFLPCRRPSQRYLVICSSEVGFSIRSVELLYAEDAIRLFI